MKVWWVFESELYYPRAGLGNFSASFEEEGEAYVYADALEKRNLAASVEVINITRYLS